MAKTEKEPFVHEVNRGSMFTNEMAKKDTDPSFLGTANVEGALYRVVGWENEFDDNGKSKVRLSLKFETEEEFQAKKAEREASKGSRPAARGRSGGGTRRNY